MITGLRIEAEGLVETLVPRPAVFRIQVVSCRPTSGSIDIRYRNRARSFADIRSDPQGPGLGFSPLLMSVSP